MAALISITEQLRCLFFLSFSSAMNSGLKLASQIVEPKEDNQVRYFAQQIWLILVLLSERGVKPNHALPLRDPKGCPLSQGRTAWLENWEKRRRGSGSSSQSQSWWKVRSLIWNMKWKYKKWKYENMKNYATGMKHRTPCPASSWHRGQGLGRWIREPSSAPRRRKSLPNWHSKQGWQCEEV